MWPFSKQKPTTEPKQPTYSELGNELYRLLTEDEGSWHDALSGPHTPALVHNKTGIRIGASAEDVWKGTVWVSHGTDERYGINHPNYVHFLLTPDDLRRAQDTAQELMRKRVQRRRYEEMKQALERIKPNPFDATCRMLANAVLSGDVDAARPLVDKALETLQETTG